MAAKKEAQPVKVKKISPYPIDFNFVLPVFKQGVKSQARVMRFIDRVVGASVSSSAEIIERLVEMHFVGLNEDHFARIEGFCKAIRQI